MRGQKGGAVRFPQEFFDVAESVDPNNRAEAIRRAAQLGFERMKLERAQGKVRRIATLPFLGPSHLEGGQVYELEVPASPVFHFIPVGISFWVEGLESREKEGAPVVEVSDLCAFAGEGRNLLGKGWRNRREFEGASGVIHLEQVETTSIHMNIRSSREALVFALLQVEVTEDPMNVGTWNTSSRPERLVRINGIPSPSHSPGIWVQEEVVQRDLVLKGIEFEFPEGKSKATKFRDLRVEGGSGLLACDAGYPAVLARQVQVLRSAVCAARNRAMVEVIGATSARPVFLFEERA